MVQLGLSFYRQQEAKSHRGQPHERPCSGRIQGVQTGLFFRNSMNFSRRLLSICSRSVLISFCRAWALATSISSPIRTASSPSASGELGHEFVGFFVHGRSGLAATVVAIHHAGTIGP